MSIGGTPGPDVIYGTPFDDIIYAGADNDQIIISDGKDYIDGGYGIDSVWANGFDATEGVGISLKDGKGLAGWAKGDTYFGIENIVGSKFVDVLLGNDGPNVISGNDGKDVIWGYGGDDFLNGAWFLDDGSRDILDGGDGNDTLDGGKGKDDLDGGDGNDILIGGKGDDRLYGGSDDDVLFGGKGGDKLQGGFGFDRADYSASKHSVHVNLETGKGDKGDAKGDTLKQIEAVTGSNKGDDLIGDGKDNHFFGLGGNDMIEGNKGGDDLFGGDGRDLLSGGKGDDVIDGGTGRDDLFGDKGDDIFVYRPNYGEDKINDFKPKHDKIDLSSFNFANAAAVQALAADIGKGVAIDFGGANTLIIEHIGVADLTDEVLLL